MRDLKRFVQQKIYYILFELKNKEYSKQKQTFFESFVKQTMEISNTGVLFLLLCCNERVLFERAKLFFVAYFSKRRKDDGDDKYFGESNGKNK